MRPRSWLLLAALSVLAAPASADARLVAYVSDSCEQGGGEPRPAFFGPPRCPGSIWVANADGTAARRVTKGSSEFAGSGDTNPIWSPDGTRLVFERVAPGSRGPRLWSVRHDGTDARALTGGGEYYGDYNAAFSPDGSRIAFVSNRPETTGNGSSTVFTMTPGGTDVRPVTTRYASHGITGWTPDGRRIIITRQEATLEPPPGEWLSVAPDGSEERIAVVSREITRGPLFSPDGTHMAIGTAGLTTYVADLRTGLGRQIAPPGIFPDRWRSDRAATLRVQGFDGSEEHLYDLDYTKPDPRPVRQPAGTPTGPEQPAGIAAPVATPLPLAVADALLDSDFEGGPAPGDPWAGSATRSRRAAAAGAADGADDGADGLRYTVVAPRGVRTVRVSLARRAGRGRCRYLDHGRLRLADRCGRIHLRRAGSARAWGARIASLPHGTYEVRFQVVDTRGRRSRVPRRPAVVRI